MWLTKSIVYQVTLTAVIWLLLGVYLHLSPVSWDPKISMSFFVAIPAAVIAVTQLIVTAHIQRSSYIKDYALRFRTDKELTESFHYLVYRYSNKIYESFRKAPEDRTSKEASELEAYQKDLEPELCFFDPHNPVGMPQERRLDNLLGFFDTIGYDLKRGLLNESDIAGVFGFQLDHLIQRHVVQDYLHNIEQNWPTMTSFHEKYEAPVPFRHLRTLMNKYTDFQKRRNEQARRRDK